ncbi:MAG: cellulase family glycosylhydrolase [Chloroflexi bacterium]|nr:cellulase family glycosylhydrolase [Chloroflexota bacterium]
MSRWSKSPLVLLTALLLVPLAGMTPPPAPASAADGFASPLFRATWQRTDAVVEDRSVRRTWVWGPAPLNGIFEPYRQTPGGERQVQYFDKSRMEINRPGPGGLVTNGLLATELIRGRIQQGDNYDAQGEDRAPAQVNVAGDDDDTAGPTYASLTNLLGLPALDQGTTITETVRRDGTTGTDPALARYDVTAAYYVPESRHRIASVFWDYLQATGPVLTPAGRRDERLYEPWHAAVGLPITRAYWTRVRVAGTPQDVLIQAFQRRVLTFTPANDDGFKVEMGNIGRHYFKWRYGVDPRPAVQPPREYVPLGTPGLAYGFNGFFTFQPAAPAGEPAHPALDRSLGLVQEAGFGWIRQQVVWATLEPRPGEFNTDEIAAYDAIVREATQRGLKIMFSVAKAPRWAVSSDALCHGGAVKLCGLPSDPATLARLLGYMAGRYQEGSPIGRVQAYEVWNEQNTGGETGKNVDAGAYVELLKTSYIAIKGIDPSAIVVFGGLTPTGVNDVKVAVDDVKYLEEVYKYNGGEVKRYFDVLGAHPGSNNNPPEALWPEQPGPGTGRDGTKCHAERTCWQQDASFYFRRIEQLRRVMEQYGDVQYGNRLKQIWLTEFGWSTLNRAPGYEYGDVISEQTQADYLERAFAKARVDYPWMGVMFVWTLNHSIIDHCEDEKYPWSVIHGGACPEEQAAGKRAWDPRESFTRLKNMSKG